MLQSLTINHIALIDKLHITFDAGFSVLTGETGAGKSILIESVGFVLGERANRESIQTGADKGSVEAVFTLDLNSPAAKYLKEQELLEGEEVTLYRELNVSGKNSCRINGTLVSAAELKALGDMLCDMHGQHAHQSLLNSRTHLALLDSYAHSNSDGLLDRLETARLEAQRAYAQRKALQASLLERTRRLEAISYQLTEIDKSELIDGEEEELIALRKRMQNAQMILENLHTAYEAIAGEDGTLNKVAQAVHSLSIISGFEKSYSDAHDRTDECYYALEDISYTLRDAMDGFQFDEQTQEQTENRLALIYSLKRKYGATIAEILEYRNRIFDEQSTLLAGEQNMETLQKKEDKAREAFSAICSELTQKRRNAADTLGTAIVKELADMGMPHAQFSVSFERIATEELNENGADQVEFLMSANRGEPQKPLVKIASGGEISRIMLAFKVVLATSDHIDTLIFDEIDSGISGMVANAVADKMLELSKEHQVLCVTHLPQIASHADRHFWIYKETLGERTVSTARLLTREERIRELARIMGSDQNDAAAIEHATKMLIS